MYTSNGPPEIYRWVDGVWLGKLEAYDRGFMSLLLSWVPYVDIEGDPVQTRLQSAPWGLVSYFCCRPYSW